MTNILVVDVMTREPVTISPAANLLDCAKMMVKKNVGSLIIADKKRVVGFISQKDILWAITKNPRGDLTKIRALEISPKKIAIITPDSTITDVIEKMNRLKFERFPVVHENNLVGVITAKDILNFHPEVYPEIEEFARIREEAEKLQRIKEAGKRKEGICEECGNQGILLRHNGMLICESCMESI
jgi:CBS domain-containing protein